MQLKFDSVLVAVGTLFLAYLVTEVNMEQVVYASNCKNACNTTPSGKCDDEDRVLYFTSCENGEETGYCDNKKPDKKGSNESYYGSIQGSSKVGSVSKLCYTITPIETKKTVPGMLCPNDCKTSADPNIKCQKCGWAEATETKVLSCAYESCTEG